MTLDSDASVNVEVVDGGEDDPFSAQASADPLDAASPRGEATGDGPENEGDEFPDLENEDDDEADATSEGEDDDEDEFTEDELVALEELRNAYREEVREEVAQELLPRVQSTYDRRIDALQRQYEASETRAQEQQAELREALRSAQLNGLPDDEKEKLLKVWADEDRNNQLDARERELTGYHTDILRAAYVQDYSQFGVTIEDLEEFTTPEELDMFVKEVELEYYRQLAKNGATLSADDDDDDEDEDDESPRRTKATNRSKKGKAPAGVNAQTDMGGGAAARVPAKPHTGTGREALAANIGQGWESVRTVR